MGPLGSRCTRCRGWTRAATRARRSEGTVTSLRWSVLPQDAERLCTQELLRSPPGSCQDRGVCRENRETASQVGSGEADTVSRTEAAASALSSAPQPPQRCQPVIPPGFSTDSLFPHHLPPDEPARPACSLFLPTSTHGRQAQFSVLPNSELKDCPPCPHQLQRAWAQGPTGILFLKPYVPSTGPGSWEPNESKLLDRKHELEKQKKGQQRPPPSIPVCAVWCLKQVLQVSPAHRVSARRLPEYPGVGHFQNGGS